MTHPIALRLAGVSIDLAHLLTAATTLSGLAVLAGGWLTLRRRRGAGTTRSSTPAVWVAALAAIGCTVYSADTSWRFAADYLDMSGTAERAAMFAAAELALFATALMARQNLTTQGAPGLPGALVWVITGVQVIPAYAESGPVGGTVRAFVGPMLAAMLWHQAMGIELRLRKPGAASHGILAVLGREARERLLSRLGIARRDRDAAQITRDRATVRAVTLATRLAGLSPKQRTNRRGKRITRRLESALGRSGVGSDPQQLRMFLDQLAARRHAAALATVDLPSPWTPPSRDAECGDHGLLPLTRGVPDGDRPVPAADTSPEGDGPARGHRDTVLGTDPAQSGDRRAAVPESGDRESAGDPDTAGDRDGDAASEAANGDQGSAVSGTDSAEHHAEASEERGDKSAAQAESSPSLASDLNRGDHADSLTETGAGTAGARPQSVPGNGDRDAEAGTEPYRDRPHPVPDDGDRGEPGSETGTELTGNRPHKALSHRRPKASRTRSRTGQGNPSRKQRPTVEELVAQLRPHVPALLERDGNAEVTRTQLREIMRAHDIGIRNDRLTPVLDRLRRETATSTTKKRSTR
ncbi:hypothetical protein AB0D86_47905 [Streptomyces sp. NPDC048324]|uniref:hypothetical protein n=1 Tax=Streptomyces sp. NPDC048324 TaxID=3157205 RepID=UPI003417F6C8